MRVELGSLNFGHDDVIVQRRKRPDFGRFFAFSTDSMCVGGSARKQLGFNEVISSFEKFGAPPNEVTVFRFNETNLLSDLWVDVNKIAGEILERAATSRTIIFNFSGVGALTSHPLAKFVAAPRRAGKEVIFCCVGEVMRDQLHTTRLEEIIKIYSTEQEALKEAGVS